MSVHNKTEKTKLQDHKPNNGKKIEWRIKKKDVKRIAGNYERTAPTVPPLRERFEKRAESLNMCANTLIFNPVEGGDMKLESAFFCKLPLCPICSWRRSEKIHGQVYRVINHLEESGEDYRYIFLTLTIRSVPGEELVDALDNMKNAWNRLVRREAVKKMSKGWIRTLEISYNYKTETFHPHLHVIMAVDSGYLDEKVNYIHQVEWRKLWEEANRIDYDPWVDVRMVRKNTVKKYEKEYGVIGFGGAVAELSKYTVKPESIMPPWHNKKELKKFERSKTGIKIKNKKHAEELGDGIVRWLDPALHNRRRIGWGGELKKTHKKLNLEDIEESNLVNLGED